MTYYEIIDDPSINRRWHLEEPVYRDNEPVDFWPLLAGTKIDMRQFADINAPVQYEGRSLGWTFGAFMIPYVDKAAGQVLLRMAAKDVVLLPCLVGGKDLGFSIAVIQRKCRCLDYKKSQLDVYTIDDLHEEENEAKDPAKLGSIKGVIKPRLDPRTIMPDWHIFRLEEDLNYVIVSETLRDALNDKAITGIHFRRV